jgi:hypothetical protein
MNNSSLNQIKSKKQFEDSWVKTSDQQTEQNLEKTLRFSQKGEGGALVFKETEHCGTILIGLRGSTSLTVAPWCSLQRRASSGKVEKIDEKG